MVTCQVFLCKKIFMAVGVDWENKYHNAALYMPFGWQRGPRRKSQAWFNTFRCPKHARRSERLGNSVRAYSFMAKIWQTVRKGI